MTAVRISTDAFPPLEEFLAQRRAWGQDTYDEWWDGEYRIVTGPTPRHGRIAAKLAALLDELAEPLGLHVATPVNIGVDKVDAKVPDIGVYDPDTLLTSPAFLSTARLVVEILSPGEAPGAKLQFYALHGIEEYLEISPDGQVELLRFDDGFWALCPASTVLPSLTLTRIAALLERLQS